MDDQTRTELEAAVYRRLVEHLRQRTDVQNIDLMNLAGFCRNCLSNWMKDAADAKGLAMTKDESVARLCTACLTINGARSIRRKPPPNRRRRSTKRRTSIDRRSKRGDLRLRSLRKPRSALIRRSRPKDGQR